jgi:hypothetical protein
MHDLTLLMCGKNLICLELVTTIQSQMSESTKAFTPPPTRNVPPRLERLPPRPSRLAKQQQTCQSNAS